MARDRLLGVAPRHPELLHRAGVVIEPAIGIEQAAVRSGIDQRAGVVLAVNLDQRRAKRLQRLHADRLVVDEGAGAAVGELHPAQDQRLAGVDVGFGQQRAGRMLRRQLEHRGDLALLGALAHQGGVAARAQRQREGIEQDRLAGAGLAGQHGKPGREIEVEPVDQNDVADREPGQHGPSLNEGIPTGGQDTGCTARRHTSSRRCGWRRQLLLLLGGANGYLMLAKARLIQEPLFSNGSRPPLFTSR